MPKYGLFRYGSVIKYGKYDLFTTHTKAIGQYVKYRIKFHDKNSESEYLTMFQERVSIPSDALIEKVRVRTNNGEWVYVQRDAAQGDILKVRIRSICPGGELSEWVIGDKGNLSLI